MNGLTTTTTTTTTTKCNKIKLVSTPALMGEEMSLLSHTGLEVIGN